MIVRDRQQREPAAVVRPRRLADVDQIPERRVDRARRRVDDQHLDRRRRHVGRIAEAPVVHFGVVVGAPDADRHAPAVITQVEHRRGADLEHVFGGERARGALRGSGGTAGLARRGQRDRAGDGQEDHERTAGGQVHGREGYRRLSRFSIGLRLSRHEDLSRSLSALAGGTPGGGPGAGRAGWSREPK